MQASVSRSSASRARSLFLKGFFKHPVMVGSIIPSSNRTIERMLGRVDWNETKLIVEFGPGVGTFTRPLLDKMRADAKLIAIDTNPDFVAHLNETIEDPRLDVVLASAADVERVLAERGLDKADYVLSGLPLSTLPPGVEDQIVSAARRVLRKGGAMLVYLFNPRVGAILKRHFERIDHAIEWWNIPPAQMWWAWND